MQKEISFIAVLFCLSWAVWAHADAVYLNDGKRIEGTILQESKYFVKIEVKGVPMTYYINEIKNIERSQLSQPQAQVASQSQQIPDETRQLIRRFLEINGVREGISRRLQEAIDKDAPENREKLRQLLSADEIVDRLVPIYANHYTVDEINQLIQFYSSPLGHKQLELAPAIMEETVQQSLKYFQDKLPPPVKK